jgi:hypothetical protein
MFLPPQSPGDDGDGEEGGGRIEERRVNIVV